MEEIVEKRTRKSRTFHLGGDNFRLETGGHSHCRKNGLWLPTDIAIEAENATDAETGLKSLARSRFENLDYDIRFGKNDPVWMKIKHIPSNKTVVFKPRQNNNNPDHTITGNKIFVSQAWDGIDMEIFITDNGTKTNYIITSPAGQRVIEFNVSGDVGSFQVSAPWYSVAAGGTGRIHAPATFSSNIMAYDFSNVPVGTVVDPSVSILGGAADGCVRRYTATGNGWADAVDGAGIDAFTGGEWSYVGATREGANFICYRLFFPFDTSSIGTGSEITSGEVTLSTYQVNAGGWNLRLFPGTQGATLTASDFQEFTSTTVSEEKSIDSFPPGDVVGFTLTDYGFIDVVGSSYLCLRAAGDYNRVEPTGATYATFFLNEFTSTPARRPRIILNYQAKSSGKRTPYVSARNWRGWR